LNIYAIGDLHLPGSRDKSMDVFGERWRDHARRVAEDWDARVKERDWVLLPGDLSWAMRLDEAREDLRWIGARPGRKALMRGNHDYWWQSLRKVREALAPGCEALQNDTLSLGGGAVVAGSRMWAPPGLSFAGAMELPAGSAEAGGDREANAEADAKIFRRELGRLEMSLKALPAGSRLRIAMLHFPPLDLRFEASEVTALLERYGVTECVFAHLHNVKPEARFEGVLNGVHYQLVSSDYLGFRLAVVAEGL